jgi:Leucine Rich repeat
LELVPGMGPDGRATQWKDCSTFDLSAPILDFTIQDMLDDGFVKRAKEVLRFWIEEVEMENLRRMRAGVLNFKLPDPYRTGESGTQRAWITQGVNRADSSEVERAVGLIRDPLDWVSDQLYKGGDLLSGVRGMLLLRQSYWEDYHAPLALGSSSMNLNALLDRTQLNYVYEAIDSLGSMLDLTILRSLGNRVGDHLGQVQRLYLTGKDVIDDDLAPLNNARKLKQLDLIDIAITDTGLKHLEGLTELEHLSIRRADITDEGLRSISGLSELRELYLNGTKVTSAGMAHLETLTRLEGLTLTDSQVGDDGLQPLGRLPALRDLSLIGTQVTDVGLEHLRSSPKLRSVRHERTQITDSAHEALLSALPGWIEMEAEIKEKIARQIEPPGSDP